MSVFFILATIDRIGEELSDVVNDHRRAACGTVNDKRRKVLYIDQSENKYKNNDFNL